MTDTIELCGAIHLHTTYSDGSVSLPEMSAVARRVGLDYIVVTDHMTRAGQVQGQDGLVDGCATLVGYEHNDVYKKNHYLVIGGTKVHDLNLLPQEYIDAARADGAIGFLAHPAERRRYFAKYPSFPWTAWDAEGFDGIELWNQISEWVENLKTPGSFIRIMFPRRYLLGPDAGLMQRWDALNRTRFVAGIGGVDAHTYVFRLGPIKVQIFPLKVELKGVRTHIFVPTEASAGNSFDILSFAIREALKNGRGFFSNYRRGDARGSLFSITDASGSTYLPGALPEGASPVLPARLAVKLPLPGDITLVRNGVVVNKVRKTSAADFQLVTPGIYRVEVKRSGRSWIFTNPFPVGTYPFAAD